MVLEIWRIPGAPSGAGKGMERIPCLQVIGTLGVAIGIGIAFGIFRAFCWIAWFPGASGARHGAAGAAQESRDASGHNGNENDYDNGRRCRLLPQGLNLRLDLWIVQQLSSGKQAVKRIILQCFSPSLLPVH